jgi:signal transduction histidine kinase
MDVGERQSGLAREPLVWLAVAYPCLMILSIVLKPSLARPGAIWPPHAVAFAAYHLLPWRRWPLVWLVTLCSDVAVISFMTAMLRGTTPDLWYTLGISASSTLACAGMAIMVGLQRHFNPADQSPALQAPLIVLALVVGGLPGSLLAARVHALASGMPIDGLEVAVRVLCLVLSIVTLCPLLLGLLRKSHEPARPTPHRWEAPCVALLTAGLGLCYGLVFWPFDRYLELMLIAVPLLWIALRFSHFAAALACAVLSLSIVLMAAHGFGRFPPLVLQGNWQNGVLSMQIFLLIACGEALLINRMVLEQRALLAEAARKQTMLLAYARALDTAEESVRKATAVDLHDGVSQIIAGQGLILSAMRQRVSAASPMTALLDQAVAAGREAQSAVRATIQDLSPPEIERASLQEILSWVTQYFAVRYRFTVVAETDGDIGRASGHLRLIYRVARELVYNACKHSQTDTALIRVRLDGTQIEITVSDQGVGYDEQARIKDEGKHFGLTNLAERIAVAGGHMFVDSKPGCGCRVTVRLPGSE